MSDTILIALFFITDGFLLIGLGISLLQGKVPPNAGYGFRTKKTLPDEKIWYAVNRVAGKDMIIAGAVVIVSSLILPLSGRQVSFGAAAATLVTITLISVAWIVVHGYRVLRRM